MSHTPDELKLHIDSDWKAQAEAEREKLRKIDSERAVAPADESTDKLPPADFRSIVGLLATQALGGLGAYGDPETRRVVVDLPAAQFSIDLLGVLWEKTKGNLTHEEAKELAAILAELRSRFVHFAQLMAAQVAQGISPGTAPGNQATPAANKGESTKPKIIMPS